MLRRGLCLGTILAIACLLTVSAFSTLPISLAYFPLELQFIKVGDVNLNLYVICIDGVGSPGVANTTEMVEGARRASAIPSMGMTSQGELQNDTVWFTCPAIGDSLTYYGVTIKTSFQLVSDWDAYASVVENESNSIVLNAHGMTVPVPAGYTREEWVGRVAAAMVERNMTWVHTAWYPFYYSQAQGGPEEEWGADGFKTLMATIGKGDVNCLPTKPQAILEAATMDAESTIRRAWSGFYNVEKVEHGRPLNASDFKNYTVMPLWGPQDETMTGAVIKFAQAYDATSFGFYVHVGTNQTFTDDQIQTYPCEYWRGYAGAAAAIWCEGLKKFVQERIPEAAQAVAEAERDGRTKGLDQASSLLQQAETLFSAMHDYEDPILLAAQAEEAAQQALHPTFVETYGLQIGVLGGVAIVAAAGGGTLLIRRANSGKKEKKS